MQLQQLPIPWFQFLLLNPASCWRSGPSPNLTRRIQTNLLPPLNFASSQWSTQCLNHQQLYKEQCPQSRIQSDLQLRAHVSLHTQYSILH
ncbi:hypothetical protein BD413DRAFT_268975 [Trametes elegans]|nr:hypothetical protein BD413DRAFT_268975 [Trametes elegans]